MRLELAIAIGHLPVVLEEKDIDSGREDEARRLQNGEIAGPQHGAYELLVCSR